VVRGLVPIPPEHVRQVWPLVAPLFRKACEGSDVTPDFLRGVFLTEQGQLWVVWAPDEARPVASFGTQIFEGNKALIFAMGGEGISQWIDLLPRVEQWARRNGARQMIVPDARLGWLKFLKDYKAERHGKTATFRKVI